MTIDDRKTSCRRKSLQTAIFLDMKIRSVVPSEMRLDEKSRSDKIDSSPVAGTIFLSLSLEKASIDDKLPAAWADANGVSKEDLEKADARAKELAAKREKGRLQIQKFMNCLTHTSHAVACLWRGGAACLCGDYCFADDDLPTAAAKQTPSGFAEGCNSFG
jgi:hypothetical protein